MIEWAKDNGDPLDALLHPVVARAPRTPDPVGDAASYWYDRWHAETADTDYLADLAYRQHGELEQIDDYLILADHRANFWQNATGIAIVACAVLAALLAFAYLVRV